MTRRRPLIGLLATLLLAFGPTGCGWRAAAIPFADQQDRISELRADQRPRAARRLARSAGVAPSAVAPADGLGSSALFHVATPFTLDAGYGLFVEVVGDTGELTVEVHAGSRSPRWFEPIRLEGVNSVRHQFLLPEGTIVSALRISTTASGGRAELVGAGTEALGRRLSVSQSSAITTNNLPLVGQHRVDANSGTLQRLHVGVAPEMLHELGHRWLMALRLVADADAAGVVTIALTAGARQRKFSVGTRTGEQFAHIHSGSVGFSPDAILVETTAGVGISSLAFEPLTMPIGSQELRALPSDPATMLELSQDEWRQADYEVFAWNAAGAAMPILVFDTIDYAVQTALFRRLAFFAEKRGFRGQVWSDEVLGTRRGWNAHDYSAVDLGAFFTLAEREAVALTDAELALRSLLIDHGIILPSGSGSDSGWRGGGGAVLSISRQSGTWLRRVLLNHELLHGLYFTTPAFREQAAVVWSQQAQEVHAFWLQLLDFIGYDAEHTDLVVNEFQAYLLQQPREEVAGFVDSWSNRLAAVYPEQRTLFERVAADRTALLVAYDRVHTALLATTGHDSTRLAAMRSE